jgi:hypothetical protein
MENTMRLFRTLAVTGLVTVAGAACADLEVTNLNAPDRERALATANDVENLIAGSFQTMWSGIYIWQPGPALSVSADAHSSSWGNFGMRDFGEEPRKAIDNSPSYSYAYVMEDTWGPLYAAISAASDGIAAIGNGLEIGIDGQNTQRALFFGKMVQGLSHMWLGVLFDKAFIVDETTDLSTLDGSAFSEPQAVFDAGLAKVSEAISIAQANDFDVPSGWVGFAGSWDSAFAVKFMRGYRARLTAAMARSPEERQALPWAQIIADAQASFTGDEAYNMEYTDSWGWMVNKTYAGQFSGWGRVDVRHLGPADQSGNYAAWLNTPVAERNAINIITPDSRVTGQTDTDGDGDLYDESGSLYLFIGSSPFPASRGTYHYSHYKASEWDYLSSFEGVYPDLTADEMQFLIAEGLYRTGDQAGAMAIVNASRANGGLDPFAAPGDEAPGCIPRMQFNPTQCGDLLEALKYEKRIDLFHYGPGTEFFDDRGWGDLVSGTPLELPVPGGELEIILEEIYTFGGSAGNAAPNIVTDLSSEGIKIKSDALQEYNERMQKDFKAGIVAH